MENGSLGIDWPSHRTDRLAFHMGDLDHFGGAEKQDRHRRDSVGHF